MKGVNNLDNMKNIEYLDFDMSQPIKYMHSGNLISKDGFLHMKRNIDLHVLILVKEGTFPIMIRNQKFMVSAGQYIILPAGIEHFGYMDTVGMLSYYWMHFRAKCNEKIIKNEKDEMILEPEHMVLPIKGESGKNKKAEILFSQLLDLSKQPDSDSFGMLDYAASMILIQLGRNAGQDGRRDEKSPQKIMMIEEWIRDNYNEPLTVQNIAEEFAYNPDYLSSFYKKSTGRTLTSFIHKERIEISKNYLVYYKTSVKEAAYSSGFHDEKQYMKLFKKYENMTPSDYKKTFYKKNYNNK